MPSGKRQRLAHIIFVILPNLKFAGKSGKPDTPNCCHEGDSWRPSLSEAFHSIAVLATEGLGGTLERHVFVGAGKIEHLKHQQRPVKDDLRSKPL